MRFSELQPIILLAGAFSSAQSDTPLANVPADKLGKYLDQAARASAANRSREIDVLSDTKGVDFAPYFRDSVIPTIRKNWYPLIPKMVRKPNLKQGKLAICFDIRKSGKVEEMLLEESSGDMHLDRAAWKSITSSSPFPPLPTEFHGDSIRLRFYFLYNLPKPQRKMASP